jgi:hypothetical protein
LRTADSTERLFAPKFIAAKCSYAECAMLSRRGTTRRSQPIRCRNAISISDISEHG